MIFCGWSETKTYNDFFNLALTIRNVIAEFPQIARLII